MSSQRPPSVSPFFSTAATAACLFSNSTLAKPLDLPESAHRGIPCGRQSQHFQRTEQYQLRSCRRGSPETRTTHEMSLRRLFFLSLALDQSKSTTPQPFVEAGSVKPELLHGIIIVEAFMRYVGGRLGTCASANVAASMAVNFIMV